MISTALLGPFRGFRWVLCWVFSRRTSLQSLRLHISSRNVISADHKQVDHASKISMGNCKPNKASLHRVLAIVQKVIRLKDLIKQIWVFLWQAADRDIFWFFVCLCRKVLPACHNVFWRGLRGLLHLRSCMPSSLKVTKMKQVWLPVKKMIIHENEICNYLSESQNSVPK